MPYCELGDLSMYIKKHDLTEVNLIEIFLQIARAVQFLHRKSIVHRDLKPSNVFMTLDAINNRLIAKLGDFGFSTKSRDQSLKNTICGTVNYVAPEVMVSGKYNGFDADRFSLGALFYNLLTGQEKSLYIKFLTKEEDALLEIQNDLMGSKSNYLSEIVLKLLRLDPKARLSLDKVVDMLENPVIDFINIHTIPIEFGDEKAIYKKKSEKAEKVVKFTTMTKNVNTYLFSATKILYVGVSQPSLWDRSIKKEESLWHATIYNDRQSKSLIRWNYKYAVCVNSVLIKLFKISDGLFVKTLTGHKGKINCFDCDDQRIVSYGDDKKLRLFEFKTSDDNKVIMQPSDPFYLLRIQDKVIVACHTSNHSIQILDIGGKLSFLFKGHTEKVTEIIFWKDCIITASMDCTVRIWSLTNGYCSHILKGHVEGVMCLGIHDEIIMTGSIDHTIRYWNLKNGSCVGVYKHKRAILQFSQKEVEKIVVKNIKEGVTDGRGCIGVLKCGHCKKMILVCPHGNLERGIPFCGLAEINIKEKSNEFCHESGYFGNQLH
jgi:serine/threonine protein kinase